MTVAEMANRGLLPTPVSAMDGCYADKKHISGQKLRNSPSIATLAQQGLLPTAQYCEGTKLTGKENQESLTKLVRNQTGTTSQLSPQFVMEMMGFPPEWTLKPFLLESINQENNSLLTNGEWKV